MSRRGFSFDRALVRSPSASVSHGLRAGDHAGPDYAEVVDEHRHYVAQLNDAGLRVDELPPLEDYPDSLFVEDPAFVLGSLAIVLRPGAPTRIGEAEAIAPALKDRFERVERIDQGFVDGGDILVLRDRILVGLSGRTDRAGAHSFQALLKGLGETVEVVETPVGVLHLKTGCSLLDEDRVLAIPALARAGIFEGFEVLATPDGEEPAANALRLNEKLLISSGFDRTAELLAAHGFDPTPINTAAIRKLDASLSCLSLRWNSASA